MSTTELVREENRRRAEERLAAQNDATQEELDHIQYNSFRNFTVTNPRALAGGNVRRMLAERRDATDNFLFGDVGGVVDPDYVEEEEVEPVRPVGSTPGTPVGRAPVPVDPVPWGHEPLPVVPSRLPAPGPGPGSEASQAATAARIRAMQALHWEDEGASRSEVPNSAEPEEPFKFQDEPGNDQTGGEEEDDEGVETGGEWVPTSAERRGEGVQGRLVSSPVLVQAPS